MKALQNGAGWLFLAALGFAPLIFGGNVPLAWGLNAAVFGSLLIFYMATNWSGLPVPAQRLWVPLLTFGLVLTWILLQLQPAMPKVLHAPEWDRAAEMLGEPLPGMISVNPDETRFALLRLATAAGVFLLAVQLGRDPVWAVRIVWAIGLAAAGQALYALLLAAAGPESAAQLLPASLFKLEQTPELTGTFYNRNHLAIYLALGVVCTWGLLSRDLRLSLLDRGFRDRREFLAKGIDVALALLRYGVLLMPIGVGLLLTSSRAGFLLTLSAVLAMVFVESSKKGAVTPLRKVGLAIAVAGAILALVARGELVVARFAENSVESTVESRVAVALITIKAIADRPLTGYGYGTFASVFPVYRDDTISLKGKWKEAHNSYLEAFLGLGIPGALVLFAGLGWIAVQCWRGALYRRRDRLAPCVAVGASLIVGLHALVDFSIQIQGIALSFAALMGAGYAQSWSSRTT